MISILRHIQYLILSNDCVVVPGLGAFVARYQPAMLSADGLSITAPSRELTFNALLTHDDGLLTESVTRREGVSYECARSAVEREVELIQRRLRHEGTLTLDRIGALTLTDHGAIEFTPDSASPIVSLPYRGFTTLSLAPIAAPKVAEPVILEVDTTAEPVAAPRRRSAFVSVLKYAASAAILVGVCLTMLTPISPDNVDMASFTAPAREPAAETVISPEEMAASYADRTIFIAAPDPLEATAEVQPRQVTDINAVADNYAAAATEKASATPRHYLVVASTSSMAEARRYVRRHSTQARPLSILPSDGRYRVYAASGDSREELLAMRTADAAFAAANPDAWVYSMK